MGVSRYLNQLNGFYEQLHFHPSTLHKNASDIVADDGSCEFAELSTE
jgi:hypothetical protein